MWPAEVEASAGPRDILSGAFAYVSGLGDAVFKARLLEARQLKPGKGGARTRKCHPDGSAGTAHAAPASAPTSSTCRSGVLSSSAEADCPAVDAGVAVLSLEATTNITLAVAFLGTGCSCRCIDDPESHGFSKASDVCYVGLVLIRRNRTACWINRSMPGTSAASTRVYPRPGGFPEPLC